MVYPRLFDVTVDEPKPSTHRNSTLTTGVIAHGVQFADGTIVIRYLETPSSTVLWASIDDYTQVHTHPGKRIVWRDSITHG